LATHISVRYTTMHQSENGLPAAWELSAPVICEDGVDLEHAARLVVHRGAYAIKWSEAS
jgi:hypothetical protein